MTAYLLSTYEELQFTRRAAVTVEAPANPIVALSAALATPEWEWATANATLEAMRSWFDNRHYHSLPTAVHLAHDAVLRANTNGTYNLFVENYPLNSTAEEKTQEYLESGTDLTVAINTILALSFVPASFVVFLISERVTKAKHLQVVSGLGLSTYWIGNFVWDLLNYMFPVIVSVIIFVAFKLPAYLT